MENFQQPITVVVVLILLGTALYLLRAKGLIRFAAKVTRGGSARRLQHIERMPLTAQHSLHLVGVAGRTVLIAVSPTACSVLQEIGIEAIPEEPRMAR